MPIPPRRLCANLCAASLATLRHVREDPASFLLLLGRRFPAGVGVATANVVERLGWAGELYACWLRGEREAAQSLLASPPRRLNRRAARFATDLAVAMNRVDLAPLPESQRSARVRARSLWNQGDVAGALNTLASARGADAKYRTLLEDERQLLQPGFALSAAMTPAVPHAEDNEVRVLHLLTNSLPHTRSGYTMRSHRILKAQQAAGMTVMAVTRIGYPVLVGRLFARELDVVDGIPYRRVIPAVLPGSARERLELMVRELDALVREFRPTVIHTTTNYTNALVAQAVARRHGLPWVYEVRGMLEKTWVASQRTDSARALAAASERFSLMRAREAELAAAADHVVTLSGIMKDDLAARGVATERITVVPNSIDASLLEHDSSSAHARAQLGLPRDGYWVGAVSSLVDYEGHDLLIEAVASLRSEGHDVRLLLAGDGVARPELVRLASERLGDTAVLPGRVSGEDAVRHVLALDAVVVPRKDLDVTRSVTPLKPIEAMALRRPVVMSDLPPLREVCGDTNAPRAILVAPDSATELASGILRARDAAAQERRRRIDEAFAYARSLTWQQATTAYASIYRNIVAKARTCGTIDNY